MSGAPTRGEVTWVQSRYFGMGLSYDWNDIELAQGAFITRLLNDVNVKLSYTFRF